MKYFVNADDFGFSKSCSDAIFECFNRGLITTTTACANGEYFDYAISLIKNTKFNKSIGIHFNLTEGRPLTEKMQKNLRFCDENGNFCLFPHPYSRIKKSDKIIILEELQAQIDKFKDAGIEIDHLDSHHHIHNSFRVLPLIIKIAKKNNIGYVRKLRNYGDISFTKKIYKKIINFRLCAYAYTDYMCGLDDLKNINYESNKIFEIMIHPDFNKKGELINRTNEDYSNPTGDILKLDKEFIIKKGAKYD